MNSETPESSNLSEAVAPPIRPAEALRNLLDVAKPKDDSWQSESGQYVSMLAVRFLSEDSDESALRTVALVGLAQALGVKEARKRTLKLTRWSATAPPLLTTLTQKDEQQVALFALAKLTTPWSRAYAEKALAEPSLPEEFLPDLLKWVRATYADNLSFVREFYAPQVAEAKSGERTVALLKEAGKLLKAECPEATTSPTEVSVALVDALLRNALPDGSDHKAFVASVSALLHLLQDQASAAPSILLQPTFVAAFGRLSAATAKGPASKPVMAVADKLSLATISLLSSELERYGAIASNHWSAMVPTWRTAYPHWDGFLANAVTLLPVLATLTAEKADDAGVESDAYAAEAVFSRLMPAWNAFVSELPDPSRASSLSAMLQQAAGTLGIAPLGESGAVVSYDPLAHHLTEEADGSPSQVRILRPGVRVQRPDGSVRILVSALVAAV